MSDYQRFITYINLYENNQKLRNVGFAKIDKRKEQCRFEIHMKNIGFTGQNSQIYFYVRREQDLECIPIGLLQIINGAADRRLLLNGDNIAGSGRRLEEISGLVVFINDRIMLASQWREGAMRRELFRLPGQVPPQEPAGTSSSASAVQPGQETAAMPQAPQPAMSRPGSATPAAPASSTASTSAVQPPQPVPEPPQPAPEPPQPVPEPPQPAPEPPQPVPEPPQSAAQPPQSAPEQPVFAAPQPPRPTPPSTPAQPTPVRPVPAAPSSAQSAAAAPQPASEPSAPLAQDQPNSLHVAEAAVNPSQRPWSVTWQMMLESYPVMTPFEGEEGINCIRIELKELRLLPKRYWYLGNNSFLLHGFFNYRYLILGQMQENGIKRWFLGVPGVFQNQEKVMAAIFGFPEFKAEKTAKQKTNQFGYWYRFMDE